MEVHTIQWVECSRCQKWRVIHPLPDGSDESIPDIWFCEMNRDLQHNNCDAPEEEYKVPEVPLVPLQPVVVPKQPRLAKSNDPESIRARLKLLTNEELKAAFEQIDIERIFLEEFGENLATGRSTAFIPDVPPVTVNKTHRSKPRHQAFDLETVIEEVKGILKTGKSVLADSITSQMTRRFS